MELGDLHAGLRIVDLGAEARWLLYANMSSSAFASFQIGVIEALGEPAVDRPQQLARFGASSPIAAQPPEAAMPRTIGSRLLQSPRGCHMLCQEADIIVIQTSAPEAR